MKRILLPLSLAVGLFAGTALPSCKDKKKEPTTTTTTAPANDQTYQTPVEISTDQQLQESLRTATKDFPGVTATPSNGEVTLTGTIERDRLPKLMEAVHATHPKKVNNQLTIK
ncbi:MAG: BON domain-containing protein [Chitinophagaceae bacterium]|nr:MAG: BON domain-containing protein [Chitinophagaceae bacterium]